jgi:hypothetical protein
MPGTILTATAAGRDAQGHLMLRTANGMLTLATNAQPPAGAQVTLQLRPAGAQMQAYILAIRNPDGSHAPRQASPRGAGTVVPPAPAGAHAPAQAGAGDRLSHGAPLRVTVHAGPQAAPTVAGNGAALPRLAPGDAVDVRMLRVQPPEGAGQPAAGRIAGGDGVARPLVVTGRVLPGDGGAGVLVRTPLGTLRLPLPTAPPPGTQLTLDLTLPARPGAPAAAGLPPLAAPALTRAWPALQTALQAVQRPGVPAGEVPLEAALAGQGNPIAQAVPRPGPALGAGLLFLMTALKGGDLTRWLGGEPLRTLERAGRGDLAGRLKADFGQLSRLAQDAGGDWRLFALPVAGDGDVRPVRFFLRRHPDDDAHAAPDARPPGRFVVELTLSALGDLQLDGLTRGPRLDAVLRTRTPLPEPLRTAITEIFDRTLDSADGYGELRFEPGEAWHFLEIAGAEDAHTGLRA